ncbi:winged helix-turn-helix domain-containing protein [Thalassotalea sp. SU-HH00458]|uniref:winged helix-turn-helix domain-containing protein n=1 Tax=Thalassotalea sp. SU-HH00458 TaxID=3127657 RepID=UPI0031081DF1
MKYHVDTFVLDVQARTLSADNNCQNIRPKTLEVLLYLANRAGDTISKQELLDCIWDDVNVDDGVIFQSIREIRQLFGHSEIILNFPRKGYQFTSKLEPITHSQPNKLNGLIKPPILKFFVAAILFICLTLFTFFLSNEDTANVNFDQSILVLPIKNSIPYGENDWIYLGAMEQLIAKLKGLPASIFIYQGTYIPHLMYTAGLERKFSSNDVAKIFSISGATLIVEAEILGYVSDYKLVYKFHAVNGVKQGVILDTSIDAALVTLSKKLADFINQPRQKSEYKPINEFNDALFAEAMISYESDWHTSISFFESYLSLNPDSIIAMIYLSKLYLWNNQTDKAADLLDKSSNVLIEDPLEVANIQLLKGRISAKKQDFKQALQWYKQVAKITDKHQDWFLKASVAEEQGLVYLKQKRLNKSLAAFTNALSAYQIIQSQIGINATRLHLAEVFFLQGNIEQSKESYTKAKESIESIKLEFLYSMLEQYEIKFENLVKY